MPEPASSLATMGGAGADLDPLLKLGAKGMARLAVGTMLVCVAWAAVGM